MTLNPWVILAAVGFWLTSCVGSFYFGYRTADNSAMVTSLKLESKQKQDLIEVLQNKDKANSQALQAYNVQLQRSEQALEVLRKGLEDYEQELANKPPPRECLFTPDDAERLFGK